jgi:hypothetical protein
MRGYSKTFVSGSDLGRPVKTDVAEYSKENLVLMVVAPGIET